MLTEIAAATAAAVAGSALTVETTFACDCAKPGTSVELAMATRHDRRNHAARRWERRAAVRARAASVGALASLLHGEIRESENEPLRRRVVGPGYFEVSTAVREQRERATGNRPLPVGVDFAAEYPA